jgi:chromosome segregation ATPase
VLGLDADTDELVGLHRALFPAATHFEDPRPAARSEGRGARARYREELEARLVAQNARNIERRGERRAEVKRELARVRDERTAMRSRIDELTEAIHAADELIAVLERELADLG